MSKRRSRLTVIIIVLFLVSQACAIGGGGDVDDFVGTWTMSDETISNLLDLEDLGLEEGQEDYMSFEVAFTFGSDGEFEFEMTLNMDFEALLTEMTGGLDMEIVAEPLELNVTATGTYELPSDGVIELTFDEDSISLSPEEYCFTVAGMETCEDMSEFTEGIDIASFGSGSGYYEFDGSTLIIWDDDCDYPDDDSCALILEK